MTLKYNVTGAKRKELVNAISEITEAPVKYMGAPSFAYEVDCFTIGKTGEVSFDDHNPRRAGNAASEDIEMLAEALFERGFEPEAGFTETQSIESDTPADNAPEPDETSLCISMPQSLFSETALVNLGRLLEAKGALIKRALGISELPVLKEDGKVCFPWFKCEPSPNEIKAYDHFICALCEMARNQKRVTAKEKDTENEKYAFRCFLLRLGFIGDEYKAERKILLRKLEGNGAYKSDAAKNNERDRQITKALADGRMLQDLNARMNEAERT